MNLIRQVVLTREARARSTSPRWESFSWIHQLFQEISSHRGQELLPRYRARSGDTRAFFQMGYGAGLNLIARKTSIREDSRQIHGETTSLLRADQFLGVGLVPGPSSKCEANIKAPSRALLPSLMLRLPSLSIPCYGCILKGHLSLLLKITW